MKREEEYTGWIHIVGWNRFQHYKDREPPWIKNYTRLVHDPNYLELTLHQRGVLHGLWLLYAASGRQIRDSTATVSRQLGERVSRATLEALNYAGFIEVSASKTLASRARSQETETEELKNVDLRLERTLSRALEEHDGEELFEHARTQEQRLGEELTKWPR